MDDLDEIRKQLDAIVKEFTLKEIDDRIDYIVDEMVAGWSEIELIKKIFDPNPIIRKAVVKRIQKGD